MTIIVERRRAWKEEQREDEEEDWKKFILFCGDETNELDDG